MALAPIVLFVYNRPWHTEQTLNAIAANELAAESILYIYSDGPKYNASAEALENISKTRNIIKKQRWCKEIYIIERDENYGLQKSVIEGVTEIVNQYGKVIVLEDDIVTSKYFLQFMNDALDVYKDEEEVISIGALNFFATDKQVDDTFFIPIPDCWGWATWKNRWQLFETNAQTLLNRLRQNDLIDNFNLNGAFNFENMLIDQIEGKVSSWAIRWQAVAYLENKLTLYPKYSVTKNIGFGAGGTHGGKDHFTKNIKFATQKINVQKIKVEEKAVIKKKMRDGYFKTTQPQKIAKTKQLIRKYIKYLTPPVVSLLYRRLTPPVADGMWGGDFSSWADAKGRCTGYDDAIILEKTKNAILKVKNGEAACERDSVLFDKPDYNWPLLTILLKAAAENDNKLSVLDFGGSLGSVYFQNRALLNSIFSLEWSVVEQTHYIDTGNSVIADEHLKFYANIEVCLQEKTPNVLILSSVLQYLEFPYNLINQLIWGGFDYIIVDRTAFINGSTELITIQKVPEYIYKASYPAWFFAINKFVNAFLPAYELISDFEPYQGLVIPLSGKKAGFYKGFIFKKKDINDRPGII
ncbi:methyltransferase, TIGR04325 family [Mucilaginibacter sp.]|uniref:methyltransferase, TIGR04325 family n=1 Tax=Mucilaginibacter sp. TaxID=1882438 RepID=UPI00284C59DB|nr:methyltransferase, TIGR04325 family [Mucilaginibacter sp.]MDR3695453.1 methyltransferase, TIGR04325 family [Mucilaginibacter sp.]